MGGVPPYGHGLVASRHGRLALGAQLELLGVEHQLVLVVGLGNVGHNVVVHPPTKMPELIASCSARSPDVPR